MGMKAAIKQRRWARAHRRLKQAAVVFHRELLEVERDALKVHTERLAEREAAREVTLADKVLAGDAKVLGVNEHGMTIVAEKAPDASSALADEQDRYWAAESARVDRMHRMMRAEGLDDRSILFGQQVAGGTKRTKVDDAVEAVTLDKLKQRGVPEAMFEGAWAREVLDHGRECCQGGVCTSAHCPGAVLEADDGGVPDQAEVDAVMRAGMCDPLTLLGETVLYRSDGRGGKVYDVPAIVTMVQKSHVALPLLRAAEESGWGCRHENNTWWETLHGDLRSAGNDAQIRELGVAAFNDGIRVEGNPLPIPHDGTVHLRVFTPGEPYRELSVPYDPTGATPRSWRHRTAAQPF